MGFITPFLDTISQSRPVNAYVERNRKWAWALIEGEKSPHFIERKSMRMSMGQTTLAPRPFRKVHPREGKFRFQEIEKKICKVRGR